MARPLSALESLGASFVAGLGSAASPCLLPLYPSFLAYLTTNADRLRGRRGGSGPLGLVILAGVLSAMLAIAALMVLVAVPLGPLLSYVVPAVDAVLIVLGVVLLAGRNPFAHLPAARLPRGLGPYASAYLYGVMLGPIALPCAGPFLVAILAISLGAAETAGRIGTFLSYGLGFGLPLVILSALARTRQEQLVRTLVSHHRVVEMTAGVVLVAAGVYDLLINWESIRFSFGL